MRNRKKIELRGADAEDVKLRWKAARQIQQELLEKKLMQCFLNPSGMDECIKQYPVSMQSLMKMYMRKAEEQMSPFEM